MKTELDLEIGAMVGDMNYEWQRADDNENVKTSTGPAPKVGPLKPWSADDELVYKMGDMHGEI